LIKQNKTMIYRYPRAELVGIYIQINEDAVVFARCSAEFTPMKEVVRSMSGTTERSTEALG